MTCLNCLPKSGAPAMWVFEHSKLPFCHRLMLVFTLLSPDKKQFKREMIYCVSWLEKHLQSSWWQEHISGTPHLLIDRAGQTGGQQARLGGIQVFILGHLFPPAWSGCSNRWTDPYSNLPSFEALRSIQTTPVEAWHYRFLNTFAVIFWLQVPT